MTLLRPVLFALVLAQSSAMLHAADAIVREAFPDSILQAPAGFKNKSMDMR